ncbi:MAG: hypothetical protein IKE65_03305 [Clostridia bacterium]|nr:hypothetical protein [Clostridia bacterium]
MSIEVKDIREAAATLQKYKQAKAALENKIIENEQWFKMRHWEQYKRNDGGKLPNSGWLFNSILNKHADAMDNYPEPAILPREESDGESARILSQIVPAILERNNYEQVYSDTWWYKLKHGTGVKGVFWDALTDDICIRRIDLLNLFWEPGITDIQHSRHLFNVELVSNDLLESRYEGLDLSALAQGIDVSRYIYDESVDTAQKSAVVDWYYKKPNRAGKLILHYCKFVGEHILYASENDPLYAESGYYAHGMYPFVFDVLYAVEGTPTGFGFIDVMKDTQESIDELDSDIQFNARLLAKPRFLAKAGSGVNLEELGDYNKDFIEVTGDPAAAVYQLPVQSLDASVVDFRERKILELKEISGNRDFNQGSAVSGVTAASAISMLQEAGNKLSRDTIKSAYRSFVLECQLVIELMRQFYDEVRVFRIMQPNGGFSFVPFDNAQIKAAPHESIMGVELGLREPVFDIKVSAQKQSPFNRISHNQFITDLFRDGFFNPELADQAAAAVSLMDFDGKEKMLQLLNK